jgi:hypothetical protein
MIIPPKFVFVLTLFWVGLVSTRVTAQDYSPPSTGNVIGITILVDFNDVLEIISPQDVNTYLNSTTASMWGNNGSVRDYFEDVSNGILVYTNWVSPAYYRPHNPIASYDAGGLSNVNYKFHITTVIFTVPS